MYIIIIKSIHTSFQIDVRKTTHTHIYIYVHIIDGYIYRHIFSYLSDTAFSGIGGVTTPKPKNGSSVRACY